MQTGLPAIDGNKVHTTVDWTGIKVTLVFRKLAVNIFTTKVKVVFYHIYLIVLCFVLNAVTFTPHKNEGPAINTFQRKVAAAAAGTEEVNPSLMH